MTVYTCEDDFESMMTCIYDAWVSRKGHSNVRLVREPVEQMDLFSEYVHVEADLEKAQKVVTSVQQKISYEAYMYISYAALSAKEDALDSIYRFLILGFAKGPQILSMLTYPPVMRILELKREVGNEVHYMREFTRFQSIGNQVYVCHMEPKNNVLISVAQHFQDRMPSEHFLIIDDNRRLAAIHPKDEDFYIRHLTAEERSQLKKTEEKKDEFTQLWCTFFDAIGIKERENRKCQRNLFPIWRRKHTTEFMR